MGAGQTKIIHVDEIARLRNQEVAEGVAARIYVELTTSKINSLAVLCYLKTCGSGMCRHIQYELNIIIAKKDRFHVITQQPPYLEDYKSLKSLNSPLFRDALTLLVQDIIAMENPENVTNFWVRTYALPELFNYVCANYEKYPEIMTQLAPFMKYANPRTILSSINHIERFANVMRYFQPHPYFNEHLDKLFINILKCKLDKPIKTRQLWLRVTLQNRMPDYDEIMKACIPHYIYTLKDLIITHRITRLDVLWNHIFSHDAFNLLQWLLHEPCPDLMGFIVSPRLLHPDTDAVLIKYLGEYPWTNIIKRGHTPARQIFSLIVKALRWNASDVMKFLLTLYRPDIHPPQFRRRERNMLKSEPRQQYNRSCIIILREYLQQHCPAYYAKMFP